MLPDTRGIRKFRIREVCDFTNLHVIIMLTVYKASAGSGKTFHLVFEYMKLLFIDPFNYRHILAVTFTNKAAFEMKSRILRQLFLLSVNEASPYLKLLMEELKLSEKNIREKALRVLQNILHDYSRFSVSTIDSFTQRIIRAFNRETGISPQFTLGLDNDPILDEAVDRMISRLDSDKHLRDWLVGYSEEKIRENRSQRIEDDIKFLGSELFREKFQIFFPDSKDSEYSRENIESIRIELNKLISWFEKTLKLKGVNGVNVIFSNGLGPDDFAGKSYGIGNFFVRLSKGVIPNITDTVLACAEDPEKWFTQKSNIKDRIRKVVEAELRPLLKEILKFYEDNAPLFNASVEVLRQLRVLGILTDLKEEIKDILHEKGILQISDSNLLLSKIIGNTDTPFIYEKTGNWFNYYIIDEFQDTSGLQWNNFKPLISNALSQGFSALMAGDVKQSIYRWRNSDWNILASGIYNDFPQYPMNEIRLGHNWRSRNNIIDFNNVVTGELIQAFKKFLYEDIQDEVYKDKLTDIYNSYLQEPGIIADERNGLAEVNFLSPDDFSSNAVDFLIEQVKYLQDRGISASSTAILIRKNDEGPGIVEKFLAASGLPENKGYNLSVISGESLFLYVSKGVNVVMLAVSLLIDPENRINKTALLYFWLSWLKPNLKKEEVLFVEEQADNGYPQNNDPDFFLNKDDLDAVFESELGRKISILKEKVLLLSPDETISTICKLFGLFNLRAELPFLQTLIDKAAEIKASYPNDLSNLLLWWNDKGYKISVSVNEDVDAVKLLTVHKAKGLEFEAVLLPFFNWDTSPAGNRAPLIWCHSDISPFNRFPLVPVKFTSRLDKTIFRNDYLNEKVNSYIDTLNLVYVALTRAKSALFVSCINPDEKNISGRTKKNITAINSLLRYSLNKMAAENKFADCWYEDKTIFRYGNLPTLVNEKIVMHTDHPGKYHFYDFHDRIRLRLSNEDSSSEEDKTRSVKNTGKLVHEILAAVETADDFEKACDAALAEGKVNVTERGKILSKLKKGLRHPLICDWFSGRYRVLNERNLLTPEAILRPDRIMIKGEKAIIVDYKWGEKLTEKYHRQVSRYAGILKKCGIKEVEAYVWYINLGEVQKAG